MSMVDMSTIRLTTVAVNHSQPSDPRYPALLQLLRTSDVIWNASRRFFERWELSPAQFNLMNLLFESEAGLTQSELGRELLTHRSNITGLVDRLESRGWVTRREEAGDRRAWRVVLTPTGRRVIEGILPSYDRAAALLWEGVSVRRATETAAVLKEVADNAERGIERLEQEGK